MSREAGLLHNYQGREGELGRKEEEHKIEEEEEEEECNEVAHVDCKGEAEEGIG